MTVTEIRALLETIASGLETGHDLYPAEAVAILKKQIVEMSPSTAKIVGALVSRTPEQFAKDCAGIVGVLDGLTKLFTTEQWSEIANFVRSVQRRYIILNLISLHLRLTAEDAKTDVVTFGDVGDQDDEDE